MLWKIYAQKSLAHPRFVKDPYPLYAWLRRREPVRKDPLAPVWILTRYDDVAEILRNPEISQGSVRAQRLPRLVRKSTRRDRRRIARGGRGGFDAVSRSAESHPGPRRFRPRVHARVAGGASAENRIDRAKARRPRRRKRRMDIIADLAYPLPVIVIAEMLGFPPEDYPRIKEWSDHLAAALSLRPTPEQQARATHTWTEFRDYFDKVVSDGRKTNRAIRLLPRLLEAERESNGLNREELFTNCVLLLSAGHETTTNLIGNAMLALLRNRDQWELLVREPAIDRIRRGGSTALRLPGAMDQPPGWRADRNAAARRFHQAKLFWAA